MKDEQIEERVLPTSTAASMIRMASNLFREGKFRDASDILGKVLEDRPSEFDALHLMGSKGACNPIIHHNIGNVLADLDF